MPNPAVDAFKSKLTTKTSLNEALVLGRQQVKTNIEGKGKLYEKWRVSFSYICAAICLYSCFHVIETAHHINSSQSDNVDSYIDWKSAEIHLFVRHMGSAVILFLLAISPALASARKSRITSLKDVTLLLGCLELLAWVLSGWKLHKMGLASSGISPGASDGKAKVLRKLGHYPFASIMVLFQWLQEKYMVNEMKRSKDQLKQLDRDMKAMGGKLK